MMPAELHIVTIRAKGDEYYLHAPSYVRLKGYGYTVDHKC